jgi:hypothetical protein
MDLDPATEPDPAAAADIVLVFSDFQDAKKKKSFFLICFAQYFL